MGRTTRIRKRACLDKQSSRPLKEDSKPEFIELCKWMSANGWHSVANMCPAVFTNTGRGLMALSNLPSNHLIVQVPRKLLITKEKVLLELPDLQQINVTTAECLTLFLLFSKLNGLNSSYLSTLPSFFSVGGLCESQEVAVLPTFLKEKILCNQNYVFQKYEKIEVIWKKLFSSTLSRDLFVWAWFCVNTRAVFYPDSSKSNCRHLEDNMALAPYLDMFNHDAEAIVEAGFNETNQCYEIRSKKKIRKYSQVFINYGPHDNEKLFIEYGFIIPRNVHSVIVFDIEDLLKLFPDEKTFLEKQIMILKQLSKGGGLYCNQDGFSWGAQIAMTVFFLGAPQLSKIYSPMEIEPQKREIKDLGLELINHMILKIMDSLNMAIKIHNSSSSFLVAKMLLKDMIAILEACALEHNHCCET